MINNNYPAGRNEFYDKIIKSTVKNKTCIDIGFGTGFLSILAIKHGASHIQAWEMNQQRYHMGLWLINELGIQDKITLHYGKFEAEKFQDKHAVVLHEIIGPNIWNEGLRSACPWHNKEIVPACMQVDFDVLYIGNDEYNKIFFPKRIFDPQVELIQGAKQHIQSLIDATPQMKVYKRDFFKSLPSDTLHFYKIDFYNKKINKESYKNGVPQFYNMTTKINVKNNKKCILYPKITISHASENLLWGFYNPLLIEQSGLYTISHNFDDGLFTYKQQ